MLGIYIHIPFCKQKCHYCDFISYANKEDKKDDYVEAVKEEITQRADLEKTIDTIYIGGGTPSFLKVEKIEEIIEAIRRNFKVEKQAEITIEINPRN